MRAVALLSSVLLASCTVPTPPPPVPAAWLTVAERTDYRATARHADVVRLLEELADASPHCTRGTLGRTHEGREIPLLIVADPPIHDAAAARASGKLVVFAFGNIHAGEVCGKEALPMLAREIVLEPEGAFARAVLEELVLVLAPIYNADGNERVALDNRPGQIGPAEGMGQRPNAMGLDLNRDSMKLESPEARAMVRFLTEWRPHLVIDTHTTNGSHHRYELTYAAPQNPSGHAAPIEYVRDTMLPEITRRLRARTGAETFFYGNFDATHERWETYSSQPRFGCPYRGLRNHLSILTEAYAYAPYRTRVEVTREFVRECLLYAAEHAARMRASVERAEAETIAAGRVPEHAAPVGLRHRIAPFDERVTILGWDERAGEDGAPVATDEPREYRVEHWGRFEPTHFVARPWAYALPPEAAAAIETVRAHGIRTTSWDALCDEAGRATDAPVAVEVDRLTSFERAPAAFQGHHEATAEIDRRAETRVIGADWTIVPLAQPLGTLAVYLLEPESDDGLLTWNAFDAWLETGRDLPVLRLPRAPR